MFIVGMIGMNAFIKFCVKNEYSFNDILSVENFKSMSDWCSLTLHYRLSWNSKDTCHCVTVINVGNYWQTNRKRHNKTSNFLNNLEHWFAYSRKLSNDYEIPQGIC